MKSTSIFSGSKDNTDRNLTDTIHWFNVTYAILMEKNNRNYNLVGGINPDDVFSLIVVKASLEYKWDIVDKTMF
ncbi:hypothetical protein [Defluviitalea phaphyphila]|uniref:hypothetical protein n=1 Tax=Defluviitalea phaphyphila TaxID=1473580 RepID=UPI00073026F9|nr:hypothetical protein [Defluviitalea phaphyphila]